MPSKRSDGTGGGPSGMTRRDFIAAAGEQLRSGKDLPSGELAVCLGCGNVLSGAIPDRCPVCAGERAGFLRAV